MGIDTHDVIEAAASKWNFIKLSPGLVGGHCISVDPYYLIQKAQVYGVLPRVMSNARRLNDGMGEYVAQQVIKLMNKKGVLVKMRISYYWASHSRRIVLISVIPKWWIFIIH